MFYASSGFYSDTPKSRTPPRISQELILELSTPVKQELPMKKKRVKKSKLLKDSKDKRFAKIEPTGENISLDQLLSLMK